MKNWSNEVKVGLFIIGTMMVLFYLTFNIGGKRIWTLKGRQAFYVYFTTITGVSEKSEVRMAGVKIGKVKAIELDNYRAKVTIELLGNYNIPDDSVAKVQGKGLLGEKFIEISPGTSPVFVADKGTLDKSVSPANLDEMVAKLSAALDDVKAVTESLRDSFASADGEQGLKPLMNKVNALMAHLDEAALGIRDMVAENRPNVRSGIANIKDASGNINEVVKENRENFKTAMANLKTSSEKLDVIMDNIKQVSAKLEKGEGTIGRLIQDEEVYNNLNQTLESTTGLAKKVEALRIGLGARIERQTDQQRSKGYFSLRIKPREDKYYMIELAEDVRRPLSVRNQLNAILYTFYIAKRYGNVTLKAGLMESSGGVGMDLHGWEDKLELSVDAFNFSGYDVNAQNPQVKVTARYYPQKYLYLYIGGDELFNKYYRTFFAGLGIMADEEDFKFFLGRLF